MTQPSDTSLTEWMIKYKFTQNMKSKIISSGLDLDLLSVTETTELKELSSEFNFNSLEKVKFLGAIKKLPNAISGIQRYWVNISNDATLAMDTVKLELQKLEKSVKNSKTIASGLLLWEECGES